MADCQPSHMCVCVAHMCRGHNISPHLFKHLVLELNITVEVFEGLQLLLGGGIAGHAMPLHEDVPHTLAELSAQDVLWCQQ